jgi:hypothetical protein
LLEGLPPEVEPNEGEGMKTVTTIATVKDPAEIAKRLKRLKLPPLEVSFDGIVTIDKDGKASVAWNDELLGKIMGDWFKEFENKNGGLEDEDLEPVMGWFSNALREAFLLSRRVKDANLPAHVTRAGVGPGGIEGIGGNLAFVLLPFLRQPLCDLSRKGLQTVQMELPWKDLSLGCEVFTTKDGKQAALTGLEENVFFSLFNDRFLGIGAGPGGRSMIQGDTRELAKIIGKNAPRIGALNECIRNLSRMEFSVPGSGHELHGRVFPAALCPDAAAKQSNEKHFFKFEVSDWIPAALLKAQYERIHLPTFWSMETPAARRLYACLKLMRDGQSPLVSTLCARIGLPYPNEPGKDNRERRAKSKAILSKHLDDIRKHTEGLMAPSGQSWFIGGGQKMKVVFKTIKASGGRLVEHQTLVSDRDRQADLDRLVATMPKDAKEAYARMIGKAPPAKIEAFVRRYAKGGEWIDRLPDMVGQRPK